MRVAIYARVSDDRDQSIPQQLADCRLRAEEESWEVIGEYMDEGKSGFDQKIKRHGWEAALAAVESGEADAILARDFERLLRQDKEGQRLLNLYREQGVRLWPFADEGDLDLRRAQDRKALKERVASAVYYSERLSEKIGRAKASDAKEGHVNGGGRRPFGYDRVKASGTKGNRVKASLRVRADEAKLVRKAATRIIGGESLYRIALDWNGSGVRTPAGNRWRAATIRQTLSSPHLAGLRSHRGGVTKGTWEPILTQDEHQLVRARSGTWGNGKSRPGARRYVLTGLLRCASCGRKLFGSGARYLCSPANGGCGHTRIGSRALEDYLHAWIASTEPPESPQIPKGPTPDERATLAELRRLEDKLAGLGELFASDGLSASAFTAADRKVRDRISALQASLAQATEPPPRSKASWGTLWKRYQDFERRRASGELTPEEIASGHELIASYIRQVTVAPATRRGRQALDPNRVSITWSPSVRVPENVILGIRQA